MQGQQVRTTQTPRAKILIPSMTFIGMLVIAFVPYLVFGLNSVVNFHDHLDSNFVWALLLAREGQIFANGNELVMPILGGMERQYLGSSLKLYNWIFSLFSPFTALVVSELITRATAFIGAFLLLYHFVFNNTPIEYRIQKLTLISLISASFSLLPFWLPGGVAVAGVPLFFWAALTVRNGSYSYTKLTCIIISSLLFILHGSLLTSGVFALVMTSLLIIFDATNRMWRKAGRVFVFNFIISGFFLLKNIWLLNIVLSPIGITRNVMKTGTIPTERLDNLLLTNFLHGQYHADPGTEGPMFVAIVSALIIGCFIFHHNKQGLELLRRPFNLLVLSLFSIFLTTVIYGLYKWNITREALNQMGLVGFHYGRFHWLQPSLWLVGFATALLFLWRAGIEFPSYIKKFYTWLSPYNETKTKFSNKAYLAPFSLALLQLIVTIPNLPIYSTPNKRKHLPFEAFFEPALFEKIRTHLGDDVSNVRLGMIGAHPSIAQFNGFNTVGGYLPLYPLTIKHQFRKIIANELKKTKELRTYFDDWGSRAYLFSADLEKCMANCFASRAPEEISVDYNIEAFKSFGGTHILSVSKIINADNLKLKYMGLFENKDRSLTNRWRFHLYVTSNK